MRYRRPSLARLVARFLWRCIRMLLVVAAAFGPAAPPPPPPPPQRTEQVADSGQVSEER